MTAVEILRKHLGLSYFYKHEYLRTDIEDAMKEYARKKCDEQRAICASEYAFDSPTNDSNNYEINGEGLKDVVMYEIRNAPEPKFE